MWRENRHVLKGARTACQLERFLENGKLLGDGWRKLFSAFEAGANVLCHRLEESGHQGLAYEDVVGKLICSIRLVQFKKGSREMCT